MAEKIEIAEAMVQIVPSARGIKGAIEKELSGEAASAGQASGNLLGTNLVGTLKRVIAAAGIGLAIKQAIDAGGELQQNLGGTEAVFGDFAASIQETAGQAYKNMGMSASEYMATANKMGSLFQGSGLSQQRSLELTSAAMQRAADVASVMGISTEQAMESIAGAAKGNFTMMDNLGVAMNATTLKAYALEKGINFDWNTADNAAKAELAMQMFMERTSQYESNFAKESQDTFTGSLGALQASVQNFMANLALGMDIGPSLTAIIGTAQTFLMDNFLPMIGNIISQIPTVIATAGPLIIEAIQSIIATLSSTLTPDALQAGIDMMKGFVDGVAEEIPVFLEQALPMLLEFTSNLRSNVGTIVDAGIEMIKSLVLGIINGFPTLISTVPQIITNIAGVINDNMPKILKAGLDIIVMLGKGIIDNLPVIVANMGNICQAVISVVMAINWLDLGVKLLTGIINGLKSIASQIPDFFRGLIEGIKSSFSAVDWGSIGTAIIQGIGNGLKNAGGILVDMAKNAAKSAFNAAKDFLGIGSPSKLFRDEVGAMMAEGMGIGFEDNVPTAEIQHALSPMASVVPDTMGGGQYSYGGFTINVYGAPGQSVQELADIVSDRINSAIASKQAVFA